MLCVLPITLEKTFKTIKVRVKTLGIATNLRMFILNLTVHQL